VANPRSNPLAPGTTLDLTDWFPTGNQLQQFGSQFVQGLGQAFSLPGDVAAGRVDPNSEEGLRRAYDLAGFVTMGARGLPSEAGALRMGAGDGGGVPLLTPVEHDPFVAVGPPKIHVGDLVDSGTYKGPEGIHPYQNFKTRVGDVNFHYKPNGEPWFAATWDDALGKSKNLDPSEVQFPPLSKDLEPGPSSASTKLQLHSGDPTHVGITLDEYHTPNGGNVTYYWKAGNKPQSAVLTSKYGTKKTYLPGEVNFPEKTDYASYWGDDKGAWEPDDTKQSLAGGPILPKHHTGEPISIGQVKGPSQDTYSTPEGGTIEFVYDKSGLPSHAVKWSAGEKQVADFMPGEVSFPPKAKPQVHAGKPTYVGSEMDTYPHVEGSDGEVNFYYDEHGNPDSAEEIAPGQQPKYHDPSEIKFPPKAKALASTESNDELESSMKSPSGANPRLVSKWQDFYDALPNHEARSIINYTESSSDINSVLARDLDPKNYPEEIEHSDNISAAIKKAAVNEPVSLGRTIPSSIWNNDLAHLKPGDLYTHEPFASTSPNRAGHDYAGPRIVFQTPPGTPAAYVGGISKYPTEDEFIMDKGLTHRVISVDPDSRTITMAPMQDERFKTWTKGNWQMPSEENLEQEYQVEYKNHLKPAIGDVFPTYESWRDAINQGHIREITPEIDRKIAGRSGTKSKDELLGLIKNYASYPEYRNEATLDNLYSRLANKQRLDMPLIYDDGQGHLRVVSGNTRMDAANQSGIEPHAIIFRKPKGTGLSSTPPDDEIPF